MYFKCGDDARSVYSPAAYLADLFSILKVKTFKIENKLIADNGWNEETYAQALRHRSMSKTNEHRNYVFRAATQYMEAGKSDNLNAQLEPGQL